MRQRREGVGVAAEVRLKDVAARAGVSISTVSRVLRGDESRPVEAETVGRVHAAARDLRYRPNLAARSLAHGRDTSSTPPREIGIILGLTTYKFSDAFFSRVIEGIDAEILANRWRLRFIYSMHDLVNDEGLLGDMVHPEVVGGLIGLALHADALSRLAATGVAPIVAVERPQPVPGVDFVLCDKESALDQIMTHLWELGHRRIAFLGPSWDERCRRFRAWLALAGTAPVEIVDTGDSWDMEAGYASMRTLLAAPCDTWPSAVVAACDTLAVGTLRAAREAGVGVPDDVTVVGFDDTMGAFTSPALTSVAVEREQLGRLAVRRVIERRRHPNDPPLRLIEATHLIVRESSGPPRRTATDATPHGE